MLDQSEQFFSNSIDDVHSDSLRFKVAFGQRAINRLKDENAKQKEQIVQLQAEISQLSKDKLGLLDKILKIENGYSKIQSEKKSLERTIELRTKRHESEQNQFLSLGQKEIMERKVRRAEEQVIQAKKQVEKLMKQCHNMLNEIENQRAAKEILQNQVRTLSRQLHQNTAKKNELQHLYMKKQQILEIQNRELKDKVEDLILQLKLHQQKKEIQGLLIYEDHIGVKQYNYRNSIYSNSKSPLRTMDSKESELPFAETFRENVCRCQQLSEELIEYEEMIELLKQKNERLVNELSSSKRRCQNLQSIICSDSSKGLRK